jgi:hypothetical protein
MNAKLTIGKAIALVLVLNSFQPTQAQAIPDPKLPPTSLYVIDSVVPTLNFASQSGTDELQTKVLTKINNGLVQGWLSPAEASQFKTKLNAVNNLESWYKSFNDPIPNALIQHDTALLNELASALQPRVVPSPNVVSGQHTDVQALIDNALAKNQISSNQAQQYFMRLAQIESDLQSTSAVSGQSALANQNLQDLKTELNHRMN